jgi:hypothetical protein
MIYYIYYDFLRFTTSTRIRFYDRQYEYHAALYNNICNNTFIFLMFVHIQTVRQYIMLLIHTFLNK